MRRGGGAGQGWVKEKDERMGSKRGEKGRCN